MTNYQWQSALRLLMRRVIVFSAVTLIVTRASALGPNVLVNGDFESYPQSSWANNIGGTVTPWIVGTGNQPNVVKVLADGTYHYLAGPQRDASTATGPVPRYYLDIANGHNDIYQSFTLSCEGKVLFGGYFSSRSADDGTAQAGTGNVQIVQGIGTGGASVATTNTVTLPAGGNAHTDPWKLASGAISLAAGTYSFVVKMSDEVNFDEAYVKYEIECGSSSSPTPSPSASPNATPSATPISMGCAQVTGDVRCVPGGGYSYTFSATNNTGGDMSQILVSPVAGGTFTVSPQLFHLSPPLKAGQLTTQSATLGNVKPGEKVCFFVTMMSDTAACCTVQVCPTLPVCGVR